MGKRLEDGRDSDAEGGDVESEGTYWLTVNERGMCTQEGK